MGNTFEKRKENNIGQILESNIGKTHRKKTQERTQENIYKKHTGNYKKEHHRKHALKTYVGNNTVTKHMNAYENNIEHNI